jgi:hypothetical protein
MLYEITGQVQDTLDTYYTQGIHMENENTITIIRNARKGKFLNSLEKYHISQGPCNHMLRPGYKFYFWASRPKFCI